MSAVQGFIPFALKNNINKIIFQIIFKYRLLKIFLFQAIQFSQTVLIQPIQFSISIDFVYTQLNVKTV